MPKGVGYGPSAGHTNESHERGATFKQKQATKLVPAQKTSSIATNPNAVRAKHYRKGKQTNTHKAQDTMFSGSLRKYSREYVGPTGGRLLDTDAGRSKFQRRFDARGELNKPAHQGNITMRANFFPSREKPYTAGFHHHPDKSKIAA